MVDQSTQTGFTLPLNFNLMQFLEEHGVPIQTVPDQTSSANSSLRRKLFDCDQASDSDESGKTGPIIPQIFTNKIMIFRKFYDRLASQKISGL